MGPDTASTGGPFCAATVSATRAQVLQMTRAIVDRHSTSAIVIPGIRNWLTFYADSFAEDEFSPVAYPRRSAWWLGFFMPKVPGLNKLQLRAEGGYTDLPGLVCCGTFYSNAHYNSGYTNLGQIIGNWVGRQGRGIQATGTYWLSARSNVEATFRKQAANPRTARRGYVVRWSGRHHAYAELSFTIVRLPPV